MVASQTKLEALDQRLRDLDAERKIIDDAEEIFVNGGLKDEYLELRREAKTHLQEAKRIIKKIEELAPEITKVHGWKMFFKSYEVCVVEYAKDNWTARNILFLSGEEDCMMY